MSEGRDIYHEPKQKVLLRTADVPNRSGRRSGRILGQAFWPLWLTTTTAVAPRG